MCYHLGFGFCGFLTGFFIAIVELPPLLDSLVSPVIAANHSLAVVHNKAVT
jgi:ribose/xylose/arabinose/galactoside ABC-type transport system permease subunit